MTFLVLALVTAMAIWITMAWANPTATVPGARVEYGDSKTRVPLVSTQQNYYKGEMIGLNTSGYATKFDDAASLLFLGVSREQWEQPSGASNGTYKLEVDRPFRILMTLASVAITDTGAVVYALYSNEGTLNPASTTYANVVGVVDEYVDSTHAWVRPVSAAEMRTLGAARVMAATGTQTLTKFDVFKKIICPNTAGHTLNLPAIADVRAGAEIEVIKTTSDAAAVTLDGNSSENIDGSTTLATVDAQYDVARLVCVGSVGWVVASRDIA